LLGIPQKSTDERLKKIREVFFRIKLIKLNAWENIFIEKIAECRRTELRFLNIDAFYWTLMSKLETFVCEIMVMTSHGKRLLLLHIPRTIPSRALLLTKLSNV